MTRPEHAEPPSAAPAARASCLVTTIDLWKIAAVVLMTIDHYGHFLADDESIWRAVGRATVPIWFFLIGFARSRNVPISWLVLGAILTALDVIYNRDISESLVSIIFSFALLRLALPFVETRILPSGAATLALVAALVAIEPVVGKIVEYGSLGWLFALVGLLHRRWLSGTLPGGRWLRICVAAIAAVAFAWTEHGVHDFPAHELALMCGLLAIVSIGLILFEPGTAGEMRPAWLATAIRAAGRSTLYLYAVPLVGLYLYGIYTAESDDDSEEE